MDLSTDRAQRLCQTAAGMRRPLHHRVPSPTSRRPHRPPRSPPLWMIRCLRKHHRACPHRSPQVKSKVCPAHKSLLRSRALLLREHNQTSTPTQPSDYSTSWRCSGRGRAHFRIRIEGRSRNERSPCAFQWRKHESHQRTPICQTERRKAPLQERCALAEVRVHVRRRCADRGWESRVRSSNARSESIHAAKRASAAARATTSRDRTATVADSPAIRHSGDHTGAGHSCWCSRWSIRPAHTE